MRRRIRFSPPCCKTLNERITDMKKGIVAFAALGLSAFAAMPSNGAAKFITVDARIPDIGRGGGDTACFVRTFECPADAKKATWTVSGLGVFRCYLNGREVGADDCLKPGYTHVGKRRHSFSYDVTSLLRPGKNVLSAEVSTGWWRDGIVGRRKVPSAFWGELKMSTTSLDTITMPTDETWKGAYGGNVVHAEIYWGETFDARVDSSWRETGDVNWKAAKPYDGFKGAVTPVEGRTIQLRRDLALKPREIYVWRGADGATKDAFGKIKIVRRYSDGDEITLDKDERLVVDFGQNAAGVPEIVAAAAAGIEFSGRPGEMLNDMNGEKSRGNCGPAGSVYPANYRNARSRMAYVFAGKGKETYRPTFTFFGGRYFSFISTGKVTLSSIRFLPMMSIAHEDETGTIETGRGDLNRLIQNCVWGMRSNYLSVPTDCPQRDERWGWAGDAQVFAGAAVYAADVYGFLSKWMTDMRDSQAGAGEKYPGMLPKLAPGSGGGRLIGWADAGVIVPYTLWRQFGDDAVVRRNWDAMLRFMEHLDKTDWKTPEGERQCVDWLSPTKYEGHRRGWGAKHTKNPYWDGETSADERQYWDMLGSCYHVWDLKMMGEMARAIGDGKSAKAFAERERKAADRYRSLFLDHRGRLAERYRDMQTPNLFPLMLGLFPSDEAARAAKDDLVASIKAGDFKIGTGFLGTPHLLDVLVDVVGDAELAYSVLLQHGCPGWLYSVDQGATTIWERWDGYTKERGFGPVAMNSFNHYAYGAVMGWMYRTMAGIRPGDTAGYEQFTLAPQPDKRIGFCKASYRTKYGTIKSHWRYERDGRLVWSFTVPPGTVADVFPPDGSAPKEYGPGEHVITPPKE